MPFADVNGQHVYYEDSGGDGPAVILSHGFLMDHEMFAAQVAELAGEFRCITWDERGFGATEATGSFTFWDSADDALALLTHVGVERAFLVGMSQGGFLSLRAALRAPERVRGLALIDTQSGGEDPAVLPVYQAMSDDWVANGPSLELTETIAGIILGPADHAPWIAKWQARPPQFILEPFATLAGREDISERLGQITAPAIVFHGEDDVAIPMEKAEQLLKELPNCEELVRIPGAGHAANVSHPAEVNGPLLDFLRRHS
jgi:pimeloyl-ACP methyl ester carboxylesterase